MSMDVLFPLKAKGQLRTNVGLYRPMLSNDPAIFFIFNVVKSLHLSIYFPPVN